MNSFKMPRKDSFYQDSDSLIKKIFSENLTFEKNKSSGSSLEKLSKAFGVDSSLT